MIECSSCREWYHQTCLGWSETEFSHFAEGIWNCDECESKVDEKERDETEDEEKQREKLRADLAAPTPLAKGLLDCTAIATAFRMNGFSSLTKSNTRKIAKMFKGYAGVDASSASQADIDLIVPIYQQLCDLGKVDPSIRSLMDPRLVVLDFGAPPAAPLVAALGAVPVPGAGGAAPVVGAPALHAQLCGTVFQIAGANPAQEAVNATGFGMFLMGRLGGGHHFLSLDCAGMVRY